MIDNYRDLTIEKYMDAMEIMEEATNEDELIISLVALLSDTSEEEIERLPLTELSNRVRKLYFLKKMPATSKRIPKSIKIGNQSFTVSKDCFSISAGQYIDYRGYLKTADDLKNNLHKILSVFIIPEGHKYGEGYDLNEVAELIRKNVSFELATSLSAFFLSLSKTCIKRILQSLRKTTIRTMAKNPMKEKELMEALTEIQRLEDLMSNGGGLIGLSA